MPGISDFVTDVFAHRISVTKAVAYTVLATDELVNINGAYTMTLPVLSTLQGTTYSSKTYKFANVHATAVGTVAAGTGNTIGGRSAINLKPGEHIIITGSATGTDWRIDRPFPLAPAIRNIVTLVCETSGTTAQNVIDASGSPVVGEIVSIVSLAQDATAANILIKNTNGTVSTIAKGTTAGAAVSATTLTTPNLAVGDLLTVESSATNGNSRVVILVSTQTLTKNG